MLANTLGELMEPFGGAGSAGEQTLRERTAGRQLSTSIYARRAAE
jgi:hypothetical protein